MSRTFVEAFQLLFLFCFSIFISSCQNEFKSKNNSQIKNIVIKEGLIYETGKDIAFTGRIIDTLANKIIIYDVVKGMKNGEFKIYYSSGNLEMTGAIKNNKNEGKWSYYYPNGQIESEGYFKEDNVTDKWVWYYKNGIIKEEGNFLNGKREGYWIIYNEKGKIKTKIIFRNGEKINEINNGNSIVAFLY